MNDEKVSGPPFPLSERASVRGPNYRSPERIELRYDGLLTLDSGMPGGSLVCQFAARRPSVGRPYRREVTFLRRVLQCVAWLVLIFIGSAIGVEFYHSTQVGARELLERTQTDPRMLLTSVAMATPIGPSSLSGETMLDIPGRSVAVVAALADALTQPAVQKAEAAVLVKAGRSAAGRRKEAAMLAAQNKPQKCSEAVMALQLCGSRN